MFALITENLHKTYSSGSQALKGVNLQVSQGEFYAVLGPNGAGKSTAIGIICSLINKSFGRVEVFGHDLDLYQDAVKACIGLVPQEFNFNQFEKVGDILLTQAGYYGVPRALALQRAEKYLRLLELWDRRGDIARSLSGGMKRRLMIARALIHEPRLLILDEPTAGVDIEIRHSMWEFLRDCNRQGTTIILTTHYLEEAESLCRSLAIIDRGQIVETGSVAEIVRKASIETFVLDTMQVLTKLPVISGYTIRRTADNELEVEVPRGQSLNTLFSGLSAAGVQVNSMRNKTNRLEEFFLRLVHADSVSSVKQ